MKITFNNKYYITGNKSCSKKVNFLCALSMHLSFYLFILLFSNPVYSKGVAAGTDVANTAIVNYTIGTLTQEPIESSPNGNTLPGNGNGQPTLFKVDRKIDLLVTSNSNTNVNPGDNQAELTFTLQNEGNDTQEFNLISDYTLASDNFDSRNCNVEVTGVNGSALPGVTLPTSGNIKLKADQQASVSIKCDIPLDNNGESIEAGDTSLISLIATVEKNQDGSATTASSAANDPMKIDTVFADSAGLDDSQRDAMHSARSSYIASSSTVFPNLTMDKTIVSMVDPDGGNSAITGSEVTYKILVSTSGAGTINSLIVTDPTPAEMTYKTGSIKLDTTNLSDASDADKADFGITTANTATINLGNIVAGSQYEIQLTYIIN